MNPRIVPRGLAALAILTLAGCGGMKVDLWPFGGEKNTERSRAPANATEYQCSGNKRLYVRQIDNGAVWVILPEREFRLDRQDGDGGTRYGKGANVLEIQGDQATLKEGANTTYAGCKAASR